MIEKQTSYKEIFKATSIFGGVQVFNIIIGIIRTKFIAVLLGPEGMGIAGLLTSTVSLIASFTNFGLGTSAVKDIAEADATNNINRVSVIVKIFKRLIWITGSIGAFLTFVLSKWLSIITFGNTNYTFPFIWISITLLCNQLSSGQLEILQGLRKLHFLAKSNLLGSLVGLVLTVPLYFFLGIDGIVPGIILSSLIALFFSRYYCKKIQFIKVKVDRKKTIIEGKGMLIMGFMISLSSMISVGTSYIVRVFISNKGGLEEVGLYTAGFAIINTYVGIIFIAMATDYYPRLSSVVKNNDLTIKTINQQAEISLLIIAPILLIVILFNNWIIILIYSNKFTSVEAMIQWAALGMFFKTISWAIGFIFLAKGDSLIFFWNELISSIYFTALNILGYYYYGLTGLGISFFLSYFLHIIQVYLFSRIKYNFNYDIVLIKIFMIQFILGLFGFLIIKIIDKPFAYYIGIIFVILSLTFSFKELEKRIGIKSMFYNILKGNN